MAWDDEMVTILRVMVNDLTSVLYSDDTLSTVIVAAAQFVQQEMTFSQTFVADITQPIITPDPTDRTHNTRDDNFINLTLLKAGAFIDQCEARTAAAQAIEVRDGTSSISTRWAMEGKVTLARENWAEKYDEAKMQYQSALVGVAGAAILSPFRLFADGGWGGEYPFRFDVRGNQ